MIIIKIRTKIKLFTHIPHKKKGYRIKKKTKQGKTHTKNQFLINLS